MREGTRMGEHKMRDTMLKAGLWAASHGYHLGNPAENVAQKYQITRAEQDAFAASSQNKAEAAQKSGRFKDEIVPVTVKTRKGDVVVDTDEFPRHGTTIETLGKLRPAFAKDGSVTAGNGSAIRSAPRARACSPRCSTRCRSAMPRRASPRSASVAAWASPCASSATDLLPDSAHSHARAGLEARGPARLKAEVA